MTHYFQAMVAVAVPLLFWAAWAGWEQSPNHVYIGLLAAILTGAAHSMLILFMVVTGRVLREAMRSRPLGEDFLAELNAFFARKSAYPAALFGVLAIATAAVLGNAAHGFGLSPAVHMLAGVFAIFLNLFAFSVELRALAENQRLLDRAASKLDLLDRELGDEIARAAEREELEQRPARLVQLGFALTFGAWLPYLYQALILWRGDFGRVSLHPWIEISVVGALFWLLARREAREARA